MVASWRCFIRRPPVQDDHFWVVRRVVLLYRFDFIQWYFVLSPKQDEWTPAFRLTKSFLVFGWVTKLFSVKTNKQTKSAQCRDVASMTTCWTRGGNQVQGRKKKNTLADSNYFYIEESITCTNLCVHITPSACTLCAQS